MMQDPVKLTPKAKEEVQNILSNKKIPSDYYLRIGVKGGGCGIGFLLGFDKPKSTDLVYQSDGLQILIDKKHLMYLIGLTVDFHNGDDARGFVFIKDQPTTAQL